MKLERIHTGTIALPEVRAPGRLKSKSPEIKTSLDHVPDQPGFSGSERQTSLDCKAKTKAAHSAGTVSGCCIIEVLTNCTKTSK